ncbi:hypothetical protein [Albirhodobacter sp. R86504]|jgi:hypothetical protein
MTDKIAIGLAAVIIGCVALDALINDWGATAFTAKEILGLVQYIAFWR